MSEERQKFSLTAIKELLRNSRRIAKLIWVERPVLTAALGFIYLAIGAVPFLQSGARAVVINELVRIFGGGIFTSHLIFGLLFLIAATAIPAAFILLQGYLDQKFNFFMQEKLELAILKKRGEIDVAQHEDPKQNDLLQNVNEWGMWRAFNFTERQLYLAQNFFEVAVAAVILISAQWWIFAVILISAAPELFFGMRHGERVWNIFQGRTELRRRFWNLRGHFDELFRLVELKLFQNLSYFWNTLRDLVVNFHREELGEARRRLKDEFVTFGIGQVGVAFATIWFISEAVRGELQIGTLTFFLASIGGLRQALSGFFLNLGKQYQDSLFVTDVFQLLDLKPAIKKPERGATLSHSATPEIVFENVTFAYPGASRPALAHFSLALLPGEKLALVGANGAGKTTLVKLLCRFYDPQEGKILIDGRDLREIDLESWYAMLGVLFQDYANYHFFVKEAIAVGRTNAQSSLEKVKEAAQAAEADVFIEEWEKTYQQMLGKEFSGGVEPSIGQWQKLALARTFYRDPRILILDEPTSSIDAEAEAKIFEKLEALPKDRTVILISHRFSTVRQANRICVIEDGRLAEFGTHEELLLRNGIYARLFKLQARGYR